MKIINLITMLLLSHAAFCQFIYPAEDAANFVKDKTLAIELLEEVNDNNKILNQILIQVFKEKWTQTPLEFLSPSDIQKKINAKDENYAYLIQKESVRQEIKTHASTYIDRNGQRTINSVGSFREIKGADYVAFSFEYYHFVLKRIKDGKQETITKISFANSELSKIDYVFLYQQLNRLINFASNGKNSDEYYESVEGNIEKIKTSTLLILKDFYKEKDLKKMSSHYKYPYEIVDFKNYENAILNLEKGKTYQKIIWNDFQGLYIWVVVDCDSGKILAQASFGGVEFGRHHTANDIIKAKHFKYATSKFAQEVNSRHYR